MLSQLVYFLVLRGVGRTIIHCLIVQANIVHHNKVNELLQHHLHLTEDENSGGHQNHHSCPLTSHFDFAVDGYFRYPLDMFAPKHLEKIQSLLHSNSISEDHKEVLKSKLFNCTTHENEIKTKRPVTVHVCSDSIFAKCPLTHEIVLEATKKSDEWMYPKIEKDNHNVPFLYHIWKALLDPEDVIRVFIYGDSGIEGHESDGCYCDVHVDRKCRAFNHNIARKVRKGAHKECSWPIQFVRWLRFQSQARIEFHHLAVAGTGPGSIKADQTFTRNDIIMVDFSRNLGVTYPRQNQVYEEDRLIEQMIRYILSSNNDSIPSAFILEASFTFHTVHERNSNPVILRKDWNGVDYQKEYHKFASHYHVPVWSIRDLIRSDIFNETRRELLPYIYPIFTHPQFHHHLFYAEVNAALFQLELHRAYEFSRRMTNLNVGEEEIEKRAMKRTLPQAITELKEEAVCDSRFAPLLELSGADFAAPAGESSPLKSKKIVGKYVSKPADAWKAMEDRKEKFGWVDELTKDGSNSPSRTIFFELNDPNMEFTKNEYLIIFQYLRTYNNAGIFKLSRCGAGTPHGKADTFDALWNDYGSKKVSLSEWGLFSSRYDEKEQAKCKLEVHELGFSNPFIKFEHIPSECSTASDSQACRSRTDKEKVKLISVKVCRAAQ